MTPPAEPVVSAIAGEASGAPVQPPRVRVYLAGGSGERILCATLMDRVREAGGSIAHDWTRDPGYFRPSTPGQLRVSAQRDLDGVRAADVFWLIVPADKSEGSATELGYALALGKRVVVSGRHARQAGRIFCLLAEIHDSHEDALVAILRPDAATPDALTVAAHALGLLTLEVTALRLQREHDLDELARLRKGTP